MDPFVSATGYVAETEQDPDKELARLTAETVVAVGAARPTTARLSADHWAEVIEDSGISPDVANDRGYQTLEDTVESRQLCAELGFVRSAFDRSDAWPALLIPKYRATSEVIAHELKAAVPRLVPDGAGKSRPNKYEAPRGRASVVDVPKFTQARLRDLGVPLWITEGTKKVDALVTHGRAAIGISGVFNWRSKLGTLGDWEDIPLKGRIVVVCFDADARDNRNVQLAMARFGAWLESKRATVRYVVVPAEVNGVPTKGVDNFFVAGGTVAELGDVATTTPPGAGAKDAFFTDALLVEEACSDVLEGRFIWAAGLGWLRWNGHVWAETDPTVVVEVLRTWALDRFQRVLAEQQKDPGRDIGSQIEGWRGVLSRGRLNALADLARGILGEDAAEFDADPEILAVRNGYVDLRTGALRPPDPAMRITKSASVDYVPGKTHAMWSKALEAVPPDLHEFYRDRIGQAVTGYPVPDDLLLVQQGDGSNGKSTVADVIQATLGGYAVLLSDRVLLANPDAHPTELMDLRGARYAVLEETPEARRLDVQRLKRTVGTPRITARRIRQDSVTFAATHTLMINTNHRPVVTETDHGTWRRLALMAWPYRFVRDGQLTHELDRVGDPEMKYIAQDQEVRQAALAWMVAGAVAWFARGRRMLPLPERVERDTTAWRSEADLVFAFCLDRLEFDPEAKESSDTLMRTFNSWLESRGSTTWNAKTFADRFGAHEEFRRNKVVKTKARLGGGGPVAAWAGVRLKDDRQTDDSFKAPATNGVRNAVTSNVPGVPGGSVNRQIPTRGPLTQAPGTPGTDTYSSDVTTESDYRDTTTAGGLKVADVTASQPQPSTFGVTTATCRKNPFHSVVDGRCQSCDLTA